MEAKYSKYPLLPTVLSKVLLQQKKLFCGFGFFGGQKKYPWAFPSVKPLAKNNFRLPVQDLVQCKKCCFTEGQPWKWTLEGVLRKDRRVVQSRDQANMCLVIVEIRNSNLVLGQYALILLQYHPITLHID